ncbi:helix-turn-helix transcriptional regulator [Kibdelosporangium philippinense]|uniref:Helix-turn-helix transcriptional regulator n=1 Tax=Kibdelosporangium philippinense TaxID=211113 RepID=A0ABS8Z823_9PSEU|nr:helix-turn-helix transcriptional regulator [Kibdelosporangium philippinense]
MKIRQVNHSVRARAHERIVRLADARPELPVLFGEAAKVLATALPFDASCWHTMDPATLIETGLYFQNMPPAGPDVAAYAYLDDDFNSFTALAHAPRHSGVLSDATAGQLGRSPRYRELLRPNNIRGELRTAFVVDGSCWGCFAFFREAPGDFTEDERDFAHDVAAVLGRGFRSAGLQARGTMPGTRWPGLLVVDAVRGIESMTHPARPWLADLGAPDERDPLPFVLLAVAERVRRCAGEATAQVRGESGQWIQVHASPMSGGPPGRVAIILQAVAAPEVARLISAAYGFTARQRELIDLVLRGYGTSEIAARLFISPHTVQGHLKSIFAKAGVRSRRELVGRVYQG